MRVSFLLNEEGNAKINEYLSVITYDNIKNQFIFL